MKEKRDQQLPKISKRMLSLRNGIDHSDIWIAYEGKVYNAGTSRLWRGGLHYEHWAGQDLTKELSDAPHTAAVFERLELLGYLE